MYSTMQVFQALAAGLCLNQLLHELKAKNKGGVYVNLTLAALNLYMAFTN